VLLPPSFQQVNVIAAIAGAAYAFLKNRSPANSLVLEEVIKKLLAASSIPTGILIILCAFIPSWLPRLNDLGIYLTASGVALLYVSINELSKP